ncbi:unnamed protein product [Phytomonas sp. EM1]|nr:unnamed protein product [Phytomonas sp. EM1]|eukprot:CCW63839.1 unnamed protein product [Phytomonas sp. isolate EM1]
MSYLEITPGERQHVDYLADLFAIVVAIEHIEKANRRDLITQEQYSATVRRLLEKYKHTVNYLEKGCNPYFTNIDDFLNTYCSLYPAARATIKEGPFSNPSENSARFLARQALECGQYFITLLDAIRLQQTAVDALNPLLTELLQGLNKLELKTHDFYVRLVNWHTTLNSMGAADTLDDAKAREFAYDLERGYNCLRAYLDDDGKVKV